MDLLQNLLDEFHLYEQSISKTTAKEERNAMRYDSECFLLNLRIIG